MLDSVIRVNKKFYPETLLEECKYVISSSDESDKESDNETDNKTDD